MPVPQIPPPPGSKAVYLPPAPHQKPPDFSHLPEHVREQLEVQGLDLCAPPDSAFVSVPASAPVSAFVYVPVSPYLSSAPISLLVSTVM